MSAAAARPVDSSRVTAIVLHHEGSGDLVRCVDALHASTVAPSRVVVVDNASVDVPSVEAEVLRLPVNVGYAAAMNRGVDTVARTEVDAVLLVTQDCVLDPSALEHMIALLDQRQDLGAVGPVLAFRNDANVVHSAGGRVDTTWRFSHHAAGTDLCSLGSKDADADFLDGACVLVRAAALDDAFPMHEPYFLYFEDLDVGFTLRRAGWRLAVAGGARAWQTASVIPTYLATRNELLFLSRWAPRRIVRQRGAATALRIVQEVASSAIGRRRPWRERLRGLTDFARGRYPLPPPPELIVRDAWWR